MQKKWLWGKKGLCLTDPSYRDKNRHRFPLYKDATGLSLGHTPPFPQACIFTFLLNSKGLFEACNQESKLAAAACPRLTPRTCLQDPLFSDFPVG